MVFPLFPPDKPRRYVLGAGFGESSRKGRADSGRTGQVVRPHVRRPHWHHFWKGPRDGRNLIVHWMPPIFVGSQEKVEKLDG